MPIYTYTDSEWGDLPTSYNGVPITHDGIGNPLNDGTWTYTCQHGRQLASMSRNGGSEQWQFSYNADGMRTQRTNGTTTYQYTYLGSQLTHMTVAGHTMYFSYDAFGTPMALTYDGANYYYVTNLQGDVLAILDSTGTEVVRYAYDAWGNLISTTGTLATTVGFYNPLRYRGYVYDEETELYYLQSRYYNPEMGRFINPDAFTSTGQGLIGNNMFAYCGNNPVTFFDPSGNFPVLAIIGLVVAGLAVIAIDHHIAKRAPEGVALHTEKHPDNIYERWGYAEGNGFSLDTNGIVLCDTEIGLSDIRYKDDYLELSFFQIFSASAVAELDWTGAAPSVDLSAIASIYTADVEFKIPIFTLDLTLSAAIHVGGAGVGIEFDPESCKFGIAPPAVGVVPVVGFDIDY